MLFAILILQLFFPVIGHRFLIHGTEGSGSHYYVATAIGKELVYRGNNVTILVSDIYGEAASKRDNNTHLFEVITYKSLISHEEIQGIFKQLVQAAFDGDLISLMKTGDIVNNGSFMQCLSIFVDTPVLHQLRVGRYDFVIGDLWCLCVGIIAQFLNAPFALLSPTAVSMSMQSQINVCPTNPAFIPELASGFDTNMNFIERVGNTVILTLNSYVYRHGLTPYDQLKVDYNIKPEMSTFEALAQADLFFVQTHFAFDFPRPLMPHVIPVGGLTTKPSLPLNQVNKLDNEPTGTIVHL